jgi:ribose transport system ATP-binding protein
MVVDLPAAALDERALVQLIAGRDLPAERASPGPSARRGVAGGPALSVQGLCGAGVDGFDLEVHSGEIVGLCGILGSGREQVASLVFGASPRTAGDVRVYGRAVQAGSPSSAIQLGMGLVPAERSLHGAVMSMRARENLTLADLDRLRTRGGWLSASKERAETKHWFDRVELDPPQPEREFAQFSGGNQQKIVLAKWLRNGPKVLLLDEPSQGVDVGAKAAIYAVVRSAAGDGAAVVVSSSDAAELAALCDRVVVMRDGRAVAEYASTELTEENLVQESQAPAQLPTRPCLKEGAHHGG